MVSENVTIKDFILDFDRSEVLLLTGEISQETVSPIIERIIEINKMVVEAQKELELHEQTSPENDEITSSIPTSTYMTLQIETITLIIDSEGGDMSYMKSLIGVMNSSMIQVNTVTYGDIASAASLIFLNGKERFIHKNASIMFHNVSTTHSGDQTHLKRQLATLDKFTTRMINDILSKCKIPEKKLRAVFNNREDWTLFGDECMKYEIADYLIE